MDELNPYAPPKAELLVIDEQGIPLRHEHLRTESHLKALGWVILSQGILSIFATWLMKRIEWRDFGLEPGLWIFSWYDFAIVGVHITAGLSLIRLMKWASLATVVLSSICLVTNVPQLPYSLVGITVHAFILRFLLQKQTRLIFSDSYQTALRQTPQIKSPVEPWGYLVIVLWLLILIILAWATFN